MTVTFNEKMAEDLWIFGCSSRKLFVFCGFLCVFILAFLLGIYGGFFGYNFVTIATVSRISHWNYSVADARRFALKNVLKKYRSGTYSSRNLSFDKLKVARTKPFNIAGSDVLVFLHIQKTAGTTFEKFLVKHLDIEKPCLCIQGKKKCKCYRPNSDTRQWLFSRYSTGWTCGLHADWTELIVSNCVDNVMDMAERDHRSFNSQENIPNKRRYFYTTFLRDPVARYISEFRHVNRGATWSQSRHVCNGRPPTPDELPWCFDPEEGWEGVDLNEFLDCPYNLANNRQTRMLADLTLVNCYNKSSMKKETRETIMLESAKKNLASMAFFGLQEEMKKSQEMFEKIMRMKFIGSMEEWKKNKSGDTEVSEEQRKMIMEKNKLDVELYEYAKKLFFERYTELFENKRFGTHTNGAKVF